MIALAEIMAPGALVDEHSVLMIVPAARVLQIEAAAVVLSLEGETSGLRLSRGAYDVYRRFHLPCAVGEVLPDTEKSRASVMAVLRLLAGKGYLVPPEVGIPVLAAPPDRSPGAGSATAPA